MGDPVVAVIDVGKTNKKIHVYTSDLRLVDSRSTVLEPVERDGIMTEQTDELVDWLYDNLTWLASRYDIKAIGTTTHGACFACVDSAGELTLPVIDYTFEPGGTFHDDFYEAVGERDLLQRTTATLELKALINPGKAIYFLKNRFPDTFQSTHLILMYDQYFPMKLSGQFVADPTYLGCHTYLFDHEAGDYSAVVDKLGIRRMMPDSLRNPGEVLGLILPEVAARTGVSPLAKVLTGIHDSNASLVPYLVRKPDENLIVNSTGTWCVAMHPEKHIRFAEDEIGKAVFYNMSAFREPVKSTILMGGQEFETYTDELKKHGLTDFPVFDSGMYREVVNACREFVFPAIVPGTGQYPDSVARVVTDDEVVTLEEIRRGKIPALFRDPERAYAVLNLSLALQTATALKRVGLSEGANVYTEGGFRNNRDYNALVAALCPEARFFLSGMPEATSFGTALLGWAAVEEVPVHALGERFQIEQESVAPADIPGLERYADAFYAALGSD